MPSGLCCWLDPFICLHVLLGLLVLTCRPVGRVRAVLCNMLLLW